MKYGPTPALSKPGCSCHCGEKRLCDSAEIKGSLQQRLPSPASPLPLPTARTTTLDHPSLPHPSALQTGTLQPRPVCLCCCKTLSSLLTRSYIYGVSMLYQCIPIKSFFTNDFLSIPCVRGSAHSAVLFVRLKDSICTSLRTSPLE